MLPIFKHDPALRDNEAEIMQRIRDYRGWKKQLAETEGGLEKFATGYEQFGFQRDTVGKKWTFTEWLPKAKMVFLVGEFNAWKNMDPLTKGDFGRWSIDLPDKADGSWMIQHECKLRIRIMGEDGTWFDRVPAWTKLALQDTKTNLFNGVFWEPPASDRYVFKNARPARPVNLKVYEAHVGMSSTEPKVASYLEFKDNVLPRIKRLGYNAVQLMAVAEHAYYGSFGYHVTNFFAPSSRSGTPEELKELIDTAHGLGLTVLMDLVHAHCSNNQLDGVAAMDGSDHCYTHAGAKGKQEQWDSALFNFNSHEVLRWLLSNCRWWLEEYGFDGFRFDGVTSMLYLSHGIEKCFSGGYHEYFGPDADIESHVYLMLANDLIHNLLPKSAVTIAEDVSGMPTLCRPVQEGGFGFDYRLAMAVPDMWIKYLKDTPDDAWEMGHITHTLQNRRWKEPCIAYAESHDQCIVGDKAFAFLLMDKEMYSHMSLDSPPSMVIDRGLALHKMIRLVTLGLGGEGYLNFVGNEFGHPEWVDFPTAQNDWSYQRCRRRFDLADNADLKYKFLECFDEVMQACENRFKFVAAEHQFVCTESEGDKVIAFERGDCLFVFNFHHTKSYTDYRIGHSWKEGLKVVLDSDEARFGGQSRLAWGHANSHPPGLAYDNRYYSVQLYLPARTVQVLTRESLLQGGITIRLVDSADWDSANLSIAAISKETGKEAPAMRFQADAQGDLSVNFGFASLSFKVFRELPDGTRQALPHAPEKFQAHFPGVYGLDHCGNLSCIGGQDTGTPAAGDPTPVGCTFAADASRPNKTELKMRRSLTPVLLGPSEMPVEEDVCAENWPMYIADTIAKLVEPTMHSQDDVKEPGNEKHESPVVEGLPSKTELALSGLSEEDVSCSGGMKMRVTSFSCLDILLNNPEDKLELRNQMSFDEDSTSKAAAQYAARHLDTPIVIISSEVNPWSKSGGLGMVASSYGMEFAMRGHRTMVVSPMYAEYENCLCIGKSMLWLDGREHEVSYFHQFQSFGEGKGTDYIFVAHMSYPRPAGIYWDPAEGKEYGDNLFRFALLSLAALEAPLILNLKDPRSLQGSTYGENVLFIANDWQAGLVPVYLSHKYRAHKTYLHARCIFVIHNLGYQGKYLMSKFPVAEHLGLPPAAVKDLIGVDQRDINLLAGAVKMADRVLTVSPNYALEIQTVAGGEGLHDMLRAKGSYLRLEGILNGISDEWNPRTDPHIAVNYSKANFEEQKPKCKAALQKRLGLHEDPDAALIGFCARLCEQKGVHLVTGIVPWLMQDDGNGVTGRVQVIMMGNGAAKFADQLKAAEDAHKGRVCGFVGFDPKIEHQMMAGCDFLMMPSQYEPCGLPQMYAQQYGTLPIVHETGGLKDSVKGLCDESTDRETATGFLFAAFDANHLKERTYQALDVFHKKKDIFRQMQLNGLSCNYYWPHAVDEYEKHIDWTLESEPSRP